MTETLQNEKNENDRLKSYLTEVIKEIEEKAPILKRQKQEYEEAMKTIDSLTTQLENALMVSGVISVSFCALAIPVVKEDGLARTTKS